MTILGSAKSRTVSSAETSLNLNRRWAPALAKSVSNDQRMISDNLASAMIENLSGSERKRYSVPQVRSKPTKYHAKTIGARMHEKMKGISDALSDEITPIVFPSGSANAKAGIQSRMKRRCIVASMTQMATISRASFKRISRHSKFSGTNVAPTE